MTTWLVHDVYEEDGSVGATTMTCASWEPPVHVGDAATLVCIHPNKDPWLYKGNEQYELHKEDVEPLLAVLRTLNPSTALFTVIHIANGNATIMGKLNLHER